MYDEILGEEANLARLSQGRPDVCEEALREEEGDCRGKSIAQYCY